MRVSSLPIASLCAFLFALASADAAGPEKIAFPGEDGVTLQGWLYAPTATGRHPAVVALHGCSGLNDKDGAPSARHADWGQRLSAMGYIVLTASPRGASGLNAVRASARSGPAAKGSPTPTPHCAICQAGMTSMSNRSL